MPQDTNTLRLPPWIGYVLGVLAGAALYAGVLLVLSTDAAARWGSEVPLITAKLKGRAPECPWSSLLAMPSHAVDFSRRKDEIARQMRQEDADPSLGIVKYRMPGRSFWIPRGGTRFDGSELLSYLYVDHQTMTLSPTEHVKAGDIVIDIGAHVGIFTNFALAAGAAKVLMLEPDPVNVECLRRNFPAEIASGRVILLPEGAWDTVGSLQFHIGVTNSGVGSFVGNQNGSQTIEARVRPVDAMVAELGLQRVDLIKIDIEGAERHALKGMRSVLRQWKPRILIDMYHLPDDPEVLPPIIRDGNPGYRSACQSCEYRSDDGTIRPHATLFY